MIVLVDGTTTKVRKSLSRLYMESEKKNFAYFTVTVTLVFERLEESWHFSEGKEKNPSDS